MRPVVKVLGVAALAAILVGVALLAYVVFRSSPHNTTNGANLRAFSKTPFVGTWHVHDATMTIQPDGAGVQSWNAGPCFDPFSHPDTPMCEGNYALTFTANANGTVTGTITKIWYTQWDGTPPPAGYNPGSGGPKVGDSFTLRFVKPQVLYTTWVNRPDLEGGNPYWCGSHYSGEECGA